MTEDRGPALRSPGFLLRSLLILLREGKWGPSPAPLCQAGALSNVANVAMEWTLVLDSPKPGRPSWGHSG